MISINSGNDINFDYVNWKGEYGNRNAKVLRYYFGSNEWHPIEQWLMEAYDIDKEQKRLFALKDMKNIKVTNNREYL